MSLFDENADVLRELASRGNDLSSPRLVDFSHVFFDRASAQFFAIASEREGFDVSIEAVDHETDQWDVTVSRVMVPTCKNITDTEEQLSASAQRHGGRSDGWGFLDP